MHFRLNVFITLWNEQMYFIREAKGQGSQGKVVKCNQTTIVYFTVCMYADLLEVMGEILFFPLFYHYLMQN